MKKANIEISTKHLKIEKAKSQIVSVVIVASIIISVSAVILNILWQQRGFNTRVHTAKEEVRDTLNGNVAAITELTESFRSLELGADLISDQGGKTNSSIILDALPSKYDFPAFARSVVNLIRESGVEIDSFGATDDEAAAVDSSVDPSPIPITFSVEMSGSYTAIIRSLEVIDNNIRPLQIKSISFAGTDNSMSASLSAITYYQPTVDTTLQTETIR